MTVLDHAFVALLGVTRAGLVGVGLALAYVFTGSLWIPIALHVMIDVNAGILARAPGRSTERDAERGETSRRA